MSSSESEDDFANIANKLQKIKNQYREANRDTLAKLDDSYELDRYLDNQESGAKSVPDSPPMEVESIAGPSLSNTSSATTEKPAKKNNRRRTRSSAAKRKRDSDADEAPEYSVDSEFENLEHLELPLQTRRSRRGARTSNTPNTPSTRGCGRSNSTNTPDVTGTRGRGRRRGRGTPSPRNRIWGRRNRRNYLSATLFDILNMNAYPTHAVGDADEPYDHSHGQELFKKAPEPDIITVDADNENDPLDDNEELSVKVYWQSCEIVLFKIRKYQKITQIFNHFSEKENVSKDNLLFMYNDKILKPDDTPDSINYSIAKLIEGGIINQNVSNLRENTEEKMITNGIKLKFQCAILKKPFEMTVQPDDKFSVVMTKCAEHLEVPLSRLKFEFDGDVITSKHTARDLELEGGECIDIKVVS